MYCLLVLMHHIKKTIATSLPASPKKEAEPSMCFFSGQSASDWNWTFHQNDKRITFPTFPHLCRFKTTHTTFKTTKYYHIEYLVTPTITNCFQNGCTTSDCRWSLHYKRKLNAKHHIITKLQVGWSNSLISANFAKATNIALFLVPIELRSRPMFPVGRLPW